MQDKKGSHIKITLTCDVLYSSTWLQQAMHRHALAGQPITSFIIRPLELGTKQLAEKLITISNTWARLTKGLKALGINAGQSVHNTRRGNVVHQQHYMHARNSETGKAAMCSLKKAKYDTDMHRPTRFSSK